MHCAFTHLRRRLVPTCNSASPKNRTLLAFRIYQGISASFSLLLFYPRLGTTRFWSIKGPTEIHVFLELSCFFNDPSDVGNLISGSSAFSKTSLNILKSMFQVLLKSGLENFEHTLLAWEMSAIVWYFEHSLALPLFVTGMKTDLFQSCGHCWVFQICWHIECSTFTASSFRIWNSSTGIPSPPLALFVGPLDFIFWDVWI